MGLWRRGAGPGVGGSGSRLRERLDSEPRFRCLGCCHVRTATACLGLYNLLVQMGALAALGYLLAKPDLLQPHPTSPIDFELRPPDQWELNGGVARPNLSATPGVQLEHVEVEEEGWRREPPLGTDPNDPAYAWDQGRAEVVLFTRHRLRNGDGEKGACLLLALIFATGALVWGTLCGRPVLLLPFLCFQVFDFLVACLIALGHYSWLPHLHSKLPMLEKALAVDAQWVALAVLALHFAVLLAKAYFIGVVWACYQYLLLRRTLLIGFTTDAGTVGAVDHGFLPQEDEFLLPPDYEAATKLPKAPPPPYSPA